jgi:hypothetical protein
MTTALWLMGIPGWILTVPGLGGPVGSGPSLQDTIPLPQVQLIAPSPVGNRAPEGHLVASWEVAESVEADSLTFEVHFGDDRTFGTFEVRNVGFDRATFLSGLPPGTTYVRVRPMHSAAGRTGAWSETGVIVVEYPGMGLVKVLMALGTAILVVLVGTIWRGHLTTDTPTPDGSVAE